MAGETDQPSADAKMPPTDESHTKNWPHLLNEKIRQLGDVSSQVLYVHIIKSQRPSWSRIQKTVFMANFIVVTLPFFSHFLAGGGLPPSHTHRGGSAPWTPAGGECPDPCFKAVQRSRPPSNWSQNLTRHAMRMHGRLCMYKVTTQCTARHCNQHCCHDYQKYKCSIVPSNMLPPSTRTL